MNFKPIFRIGLLFAAIFFSPDTNAQNFFYSAPVGNYPFSDFKIIGRVKNNIIVHNYTWSHTFDMRKSEILVYDDKMQLMHTTSFKSLAPKFSSVDFINEGTSFSAIIQGSEDGFFVLKLISFDANGNVLNTQMLERSAAPQDGKYAIIKSSKNKSVALLKIVPSEMGGTIALRYHFIKNDSLIRSDKMILPFDTVSSELGEAFLDDNNLIVPVSDTSNGERLALFKLDLRNNSSTNTIRDLNKGFLILPGLHINENDKYYVVTSQWTPANDSFDVANKIFLWQLNKDLTDITTDTILAIDSSNSCLQNIFYYQVKSIVSENNNSNIIISTETVANDDGADGTYYFTPAYNNSVPATVGGSFYEGRVLSMMSLRELNGNGYSTWANIENGPTWTNNTGLLSNSGYYKRRRTLNSQIATIAVLNIDIQNRLNWAQCFDVSMEKGFKSLVNESVVLKMQKSSHIIYSKSVPDGKQALGDIVLSCDGNYIIKPIIAMNIKYKYWLKESLQIDSNAVIIPCFIKGKLAFAKLRVE